MSELIPTPEAEVEVDGPAKEWWESKGVWGSIVVVGAIAAGYAGYNIDTGLQDEIVSAITDVIALGGAVLALIGRTVATKEIRG